MPRKVVGLASFVLFALYVTGCMFLVTLGVATYRNVCALRDDADEVRVSLSYVANKLHAGDIEGAISLEVRDGFETCVIRYEGGDECETLIYYYDGALYELFKFTDTEIPPQYGTVLCTPAEFHMTLEGNVFTLSTVSTRGTPCSVSCCLQCAVKEEAR